MSRIKIIIPGLCVILAAMTTAYGSDDPGFGNCIFKDPALIPRHDSPEYVRTAKREFRKQFGNKVPYDPNFVADVTNLTLDRWELIAGFDIGPKAQVNVFTEYYDPENDVVTYAYMVSGGKIIGQGARVVWDLSGLAPGTYTILAGVSDGVGVCGKTEKRRVEILACETCRLRET